MKKIYLVFALSILSTNTFAKTESISVRSYLDTEFEAMFELKVFEYPKVILDCQSFFHQLVVYKGTDKGKDVKRNFHLDFEQCYRAHEFLYQSQDENKPVCLSLDYELGVISLSNTSIKDCKKLDLLK